MTVYDRFNWARSSTARACSTDGWLSIEILASPPKFAATAARSSRAELRAWRALSSAWRSWFTCTCEEIPEARRPFCRSYSRC